MSNQRADNCDSQHGPRSVQSLFTSAERVPGTVRSAAYVLARRIWDLPADVLATLKRSPARGVVSGVPRAVFMAPERRTVGPLVTVITRTAGRNSVLLSRCVSSVENQTYAPIEHLIVEDGGSSMEELCRQAQRLVSSGRTIRYVPMPKIGRAGAGNAGLESSTGEFVVFLDDDDEFYPDCLAELVSALTSDDVASVCTAHRARHVRRGPLRQRDLAVRIVRQPPFTYERLRSSNLFPIQCVLFRRSRFEELGGFRELDAFEDWNLWLRYLQNHRFSVVAKTLSLYREPASIRAEVRARRFMADRFCAVARQNECDGVGQ